MLLYIDPGTGSMLFTIILGVISVLFFAFQKFLINIKTIVRGGGQKVETNYMPYVIFSDSKRYWNLFKPICDEFEKRKTRLVYWTTSPDDPGLEEKYEYVTLEYIGDINKAVTRLNFMNAGICISTTPGLDVYQWKRSRNTKWYVHVWHGAGDATGYRMFGLDFFDAVLLSGQYQVEQLKKLEEIRHTQKKDLLVTGITYMDALLDKKNAASLPDNKKTTVLLAPSWGKSSILCKYGNSIIDSLIATGYRIIIRPHPQSMISDKAVVEPLIKQYPESEMLSWNFDNDNFEVLNQADIMISDFSSVIWDYTLVFDRPLIYADTEFDKSPYDACWLDEEMWVFQTLPSVGLPLRKEDLPRMKEIIDAAIASEDLQAGRKAAREMAWEHIGESAVHITDYVMEKYQQLESGT